MLTAAFCFALSVRLSAQTAAAPVTATPADDEPIVLSPFVVDASEDSGYLATSTLAGSRVRTELKNVASSISVVTSQFLKDTGVKNSNDLLVYTTNTEVGGIQGNFAGFGNAYIDGASEGSLLRPTNRVRGLDSADNTRDFFQSDIPWDTFNVGRVDLQRGPNSILFGIGSPAGIINSSVNTAGFKNEGKIEDRVGSFGSVRNSIDVNRVILDKELAVRFSAVYDDAKYRQSYTFNKDQRLFGALRWDPKFLSTDSIHTSIRANYEHGDMHANSPRSLPPEDRITPYFDPAGINKQTYDPFLAWQTGQMGSATSAPLPGYVRNYYLVQYMGPGTSNTYSPTFTYASNGAATPSMTRQSSPTTYYGLNSDGTRGGGIDGFPYGSNIGIGSYADYVGNYSRNGGTNPYPAYDKGFYKRKSLSDPTIFDFYNNLIDGPNKKEWQGWDAFNISLSQTFLTGRVGYEFVYDRQKYNNGNEQNLNNPFISVDIRANLMDAPALGNMPLRVNPNAGKAFTGSNVGGGNNASVTDRENFRFTVFGELTASDFLGKSTLSNILGHHLVTGLYSKETYDVLQQSWARYGVDSTWNSLMGDYTGTGGFVALDWLTYLSDSLVSVPSAHGLNLRGVTVTQSPTGSFNIPYFDSHWNKPTNPADPAYVDPAAVFINGARPSTTEPLGSATTQSENIANYVGWVNRSFNVLNADNGDRNRLLSNASNVQQKTTSKAFTWQAYFWDDTLVGTFGARQDQLSQRFGASGSDLVSSNGAGVANPDPALAPLAANAVSKGNTVSWGLVLHTPKALKAKLPWGTDISLTYNDSRNTRVETRYSFDGGQLPNAAGRTKDVGLVVSMLNEKLQFKVVSYKTTVTDANISSVSSETATLGANTYYIKNLEYWGTASALYGLAGREVDSSGHSLASGSEWYWNWALVDGGWDGKYNDPTGADFKNSASTLKQTTAINSWLSQLLPQSWFDAYGFPVNVAAAKQGDWRHGLGGYSSDANTGYLYPSAGGASGGGRINGSWPTGTVNNESKGLEFEITGEPVHGLNLSINASKQRAAQTSLGASLSAFLDAQHTKYMSPAGDLRLWWGGDATVRQYFNENIWSAYQFQLQTNGKLVSEMSPWSFNTVANYRFDSGALKHANVGFGYRWKQGTVLGYALNAKKDNLDVEKPLWGKAEGHFDLWAGYDYRLTQKLGWRIQINLRNVGESVHLRPFSLEPDGSTALSRIEEGMTWQLTNTISF